MATSIGLRRRVQALATIGYTAREVAAVTGVPEWAVPGCFLAPRRHSRGFCAAHYYGRQPKPRLVPEDVAELVGGRQQARGAAQVGGEVPATAQSRDPGGLGTPTESAGLK